MPKNDDPLVANMPVDLPPVVLGIGGDEMVAKVNDAPAWKLANAIDTADPGPEGGLIYRHAPGIEVWGAVLFKYQALGGPAAFLGLPLEAQVANPGGRGVHQRFKGGEIHATSAGTHVIYGDILEHWKSVKGWVYPLGYPTSDEMDGPDGGRVSCFEGGFIYWWPEIGTVDLKSISIKYVGLGCVETTSGPGDDEPYVVAGVYARRRDPADYQYTNVVRSQIYDGVGDHSGRFANPQLTLYSGPLRDMWLFTMLFEHDYGNADDAVNKLRVGWQEIPGDTSTPTSIDDVSRLLGFDDDTVGTATTMLNAQAQIGHAQVGRTSEFNISHSFAIPINGDGASYKVYYIVEIERSVPALA